MFRGLSKWNVFVYLLNVLFALVMLVAFLVPLVPANVFPYLSPLGLGIPVLVVLHLFFVCYWAVQWKRRLWLSVVLLLFGYFFMGSFFKVGFSSGENGPQDLKVMTYNVRGFNKWRAIAESNIYNKIFDFIAMEDPDIICFQEVDYLKRGDFKKYPYQHLKYINNTNRVLLGIFSKYPIVDQGTLDWPNSINNAAFADIALENDTIRVYNLHMESLRIVPEKAAVVAQPYDNVYKKLVKAFKKQSEQATIFRAHREPVSYSSIVCGDFNNNQFSNAYRIIKGDMQDAFNQKGNGLGETYNFLGIPLRIDFILSDPKWEVSAYKSYEVRYSDHFPVMASFRLSEN